MMELILVELSSPLKVRTMPEENLEVFADSQGFKEPDADQSNGFYDFMRSDPDTIVGVRWSPFPQAEFVLNRVPDSPLLTIVPNGMLKSLRIWLRGPVEFDDTISDDQLFWNNRIFLKESTGEVMITFALPPTGWPK
jgi:hypothetical protein